MTDPGPIVPAEHVGEDPLDGWKAVDLADDERVDDDFISSDCSRVFEPLLPENEKLY